MFDKIDHIGIAVKDMDAAIALYEKMGAKLIARETKPDGSTDLAMLELGGSRIEPISPLRDDTKLAKFLQEHGEGLHHLAYNVTNIEGVIAELKAQGFEMIDEKSRPGFGGHLVDHLETLRC